MLDPNFSLPPGGGGSGRDVASALRDRTPTSGRSLIPALSELAPPARKRVLIAADTFPPDINGAAHFARDHAVRLARRGHEVHVVAPATRGRSSTAVERFEGVSIRVHRLRSVRWPVHARLRVTPPWEVRRHARRILQEIDPDVVHVQSGISIGRGFVIEAHALGTPTVATNHVMPENVVEYSGLPGVVHPHLSRYGWSVASTAYAHADALTSPTPTAARYLEQSTGLGPVLAVSCGIDLHRFTPKTRKPGSARILYAGRLDPEKDVDTLLAAFALLPRGSRARLDLVGDGAQRKELESLARRTGIADRVRFHGRVTDQELSRLHHLATVFVMPSPVELQSIATLEALASGTPVVVADAMALPHLVEDGVEGYRVPAGNAHDFAHRIERVLETTPARYLQLTRAALARAREHDSAVVVEHYERLYDQVCRFGIPVTA